MSIERLVITLFILVTVVGIYYLMQKLQVKHINDITLGKRSTPTLLYFHSDQCVTCPTQSHHLTNLLNSVQKSDKNEPLKLQEIDVVQEPDEAKKYRVFTLPTTVILDNSGGVRHINYGLTNSATLAQQLEGIL